MANFVFIAESKDDWPKPLERYGEKASEWKPYYPPHSLTALQHAKKAIGNQFKLREIKVDDNLSDELEAAKKRNNLSIVLGERKAFSRERFEAIQQVAESSWRDCALVLPQNSADAESEHQSADFNPLPKCRSIYEPKTPSELEESLGQALFEMRQAVTQPKIDSKESTEPPPPNLSAKPPAKT